MMLYRLLLHLYPAGFRAEYGDDMAMIFKRRQRDSRGPVATAWLWIQTVADVLINAIGAHFDLFVQDLRYASRTLAKAPGFTLTTILVTALGVGANTAVFTIMDTVLLRPLPYPNSIRLVKMWERKPGYMQMELSPPNYRDWKAQATTLEGMSAFRGQAVNLVGQGEPLHLEGASLTAGMMPLLGVQALRGRVFSEDDDREQAPATLVLSYGLWHSQFGADPAVLGRTVLLDSTPHTIIGVMKPDFRFPNKNARFWTAMRFAKDDFGDRNNNYLHAVAKLKPGVELAQAREEMRIITANLEKAYPKENEKTGATVNLLRDEISDRTRLLVHALSGAALCLLLIACLNLANLQLARGMSRQKELTVRASLGAGRERLVRQLATEGLLLALLGGLAGILAASSAIPFLARMVPENIPFGEPQIDFRVLGFSFVLTLLTGVAFGVLPSLRIAGGFDSSGLREGSRGGVGGRRERMRGALVMAEVALSMVLLISTGLLIRALLRIQSVDPGFRADGVVTMRTPLPMPKYQKTARRTQFFQSVLGEIKQLPGVTDAAYISFLPIAMRGGIWAVNISGNSMNRAENHTASLRFITPGFFESLKIPIRKGRDVSDRDTMSTQLIAVVSESFVRRYWPGEDPLGRRFNIGFAERTVAGVVQDIRVRGLEQTSEPQVYLPYQQTPDGALVWYAPKDLVVRSALDPDVILPAIRSVIRKADAELPITRVQTLTEVVQGDTGPRSAQVRMLGVFAALAALLAAVGIHGLLSFGVSQRKQEIGVRMALGAGTGHILQLVLRESLLLSGIGMAVGLAGAYAAGISMRSILAGVEPADAITFIGAAAVCFLMTMAGSLWPAYGAVNVDPAITIRME